MGIVKEGRRSGVEELVDSSGSPVRRRLHSKFYPSGMISTVTSLSPAVLFYDNPSSSSTNLHLLVKGLGYGTQKHRE